MGIPRLTQDLQAFLEPCYLCPQQLNERGVRLQNIVIDGPSMVYHIYYKLATYRLGTTSTKGLCDLPTYEELVHGVEHFLEDLESCGANILHIFFDGFLPFEKRSVRLQRLEKSRLALVAERTAHPHLILAEHHYHKLNPESLQEILWQPSDRRPQTISELFPPFIVPVAIEYLAASRWSSRTCVVPGEAESYCAPIAKRESAAVLTNDSDLVLFEDLCNNGVVVLLHSLKMIASSSIPLIEGRCWRSKLIREKTGVERLLDIGFERAKNSSASYGVILQRVKGSAHFCEEAELRLFAKQFEIDKAKADCRSQFELNRLDPRLAEVVCQFRGIARAQASALKLAESIFSTLPLLLEDPARDSSWSYGKSFRGLAYTLLSKHYLHVANHSHSLGFIKPSTVMEHSRKGQRVAPEAFSLNSLSGQVSSMETLLNGLERPSTVKIASQRHNCALCCAEPAEWILSALQIVLNSRVLQGKRVFAAQTILQLLGVASIHSLSSPKSANGDSESTWTLLHLHANVHAVLYSLRMLKQVFALIRANGHTKQSTRAAASLFELDTATLTQEDETSLTNIERFLETLPCMKCLFLNLPEMINFFRDMEREQLRVLLEAIVDRYNLRSSLPPTLLFAEKVEEDERRCEEAKDDEFVAARTKRKRKAAKPPNLRSESGAKKLISAQKDSNLFSVLMDRD